MSEPAEPRPHGIPASLRDLVMVDLLELTGSTTATAALLSMSQPNVSRRYRSLARELGLERRCDAPVGRRYGDTPWIALLRRGVNHHRLAGGVLRVGGSPALEPLLADLPWMHWVRLGRQQQRHWRYLLELELVDAVAVAQLPELGEDESTKLAVVEVQSSPCVEPVHLLCRQDPLVLELCAQVIPTR
jgi:hypothetical protein